MYNRVLLLLIFTFFSVPLYAHHLHDRNATVIIGYAENWAPYSYVADDGTPRGILVELMEKIIKEKLKLKVIHQVIPWKQAQALTQTGVYDAIITNPTPERLETMIASKALYHLEWRLFISKSHRDFDRIQSMEDPLTNSALHYLSVLGDQTTELFYKKNNLDYETVKSIQEAVNMLDSGRSPLLLHSKLTTLYALYHFSLHDKIAMHTKSYSMIPFHLLISKKSRYKEGLVSEVNQVIDSMNNSKELEKAIDDIEEKEIARVLKTSNLH